MSKILAFFILFVSINGFSQNKPNEKYRNNKISADIVKPFYGHFIITYEHFLKNKNSIGIKFGNFDTDRTIFKGFYAFSYPIHGVSSEIFYNFNYFQRVKQKTINTHYMGFFLNFKKLIYYGRDPEYPNKGVYDYFDMKTLSGGFTLGRSYLFSSGISFNFFIGGGVSKCLDDFFDDDVLWLYYPNGFIIKAGVEIGYNF